MMPHDFLPLLLVAAQVAVPPAIPSVETLTIISPIEPENCALEIRATSDAADTNPTKIKLFATGQAKIERPLTEEEQARPTADAIIQLDGGWYAQGRPSLYRIGAPDNDPAKASAPYLGMTIEPAFASLISSATFLQLWDNTDAREHFDLRAVSQTNRDAWKECIKNLQIVSANASDVYPYYPAYYRRQKPLQPVTPINRHAWVTSDDYPSSAIRQELQGTVAFTLAIGVNGRVQSCGMTKNENPTIMASINDVPELNIATCRILSRRARFIPATDAEGRPLLANYSGRVRWALPYDPPPPPPPQLPKRF